VGDIGLVCIDPITAYMGGKINSHVATDVRSVLSPLKDLAERTHVPFSAITHPAKNASQRALDHFIGSQAYIAVARLGHSCVDEMEEDATGLRQLSGRALFTNPKNSLGPRMPSLAYRIAETTIAPLGKDIKISKIPWEEVVDITADEALAEASSTAKRVKHNPVTFLLTILANGPVLKKIIEAEAEKQGISAKQLRQAREKMGLVVYRRKGQVAGGALWSKPQDAPPKE
jgi:putative DNA primase/helicase